MAVDYDTIKNKHYSLAAGQYFDIKIERIDITPDEFTHNISMIMDELDSMLIVTRQLEADIRKQMKRLKYE